MRGSGAVRCVLPCTVTKKLVDISVKQCPNRLDGRGTSMSPSPAAPRWGASQRGLLFPPWPVEQLYVLAGPRLAVCVWRKTTFFTGVWRREGKRVGREAVVMEGNSCLFSTDYSCEERDCQQH